jgi:hypothetical protein
MELEFLEEKGKEERLEDRVIYILNLESVIDSRAFHCMWKSLGKKCQLSHGSETRISKAKCKEQTYVVMRTQDIK